MATKDHEVGGLHCALRLSLHRSFFLISYKECLEGLFAVTYLNVCTTLSCVTMLAIWIAAIGIMNPEACTVLLD